MLKGRKQSNTYLVIICRHRWNAQMTMKKNIKWSFQPAQWFLSADCKYIRISYLYFSCFHNLKLLEPFFPYILKIDQQSYHHRLFVLVLVFLMPTLHTQKMTLHCLILYGGSRPLSGRYWIFLSLIIYRRFMLVLSPE